MYAYACTYLAIQINVLVYVLVQSEPSQACCLSVVVVNIFIFKKNAGSIVCPSLPIREHVYTSGVVYTGNPYIVLTNAAPSSQNDCIPIDVIVIDSVVVVEGAMLLCCLRYFVAVAFGC